MKLRRALHLVGAGALTGALFLGTAPTASADDIRDRQWAMDAFGANDIWKHATGDGVTVAVIDTGVDSSMPDLVGQVLKGEDYTSGGGGDGRVDIANHGTEVASIIAGHGHGPDGKAGMKGLAPEAKILPLRVMKNEQGERSFAAKAIRYAVKEGADVINISEGTFSSPAEKAAIEFAIKNDVIVVAASGNSGRKEKNYPAAYPGVVSVGGVDKTGSVWDRSSWGSNVSLVGPADDVVVEKPDSPSGYAMADGTSFATAFVSATAALVREAHPDLTAGQVINRMTETAMIPEGESANSELPDPKFGYGIVRPFRAVTYDMPAGPKAGPLPQPSPSPSDAGTADLADSDDSSSGDWMYVLGPPIVLFGLIFVILVVLAAILVTVVVIKKRQNSSVPQSTPGQMSPVGQPEHGPMVPGQAPGPGYQVPQQPNQFVPHQSPPGQFGSPPPTSPQAANPPATQYPNDGTDR